MICPSFYTKLALSRIIHPHFYAKLALKLAGAWPIIGYMLQNSVVTTLLYEVE